LLLWAGEARGQVIDLRTLRLPQWRLQEELRIGSVDGPDDALASPTVGAVAPDGRIYVLDRAPGSPVIKVFDARGGFIRAIGAHGQGPGEYASISAFGMRGDTVWVSDGGTGRITFYRTDGELIESFRFGAQDPQDPTRVSHVPVAILSADRFIVISPPGPDIRSMDVGPVTFRQSRLLTDRRGSILDTLFVTDVDYPVIITSPRGRGIFIHQPAFRDAPIVVYSSAKDQVREIHRRTALSASDGEFRFVIRTRAGDTLNARTFRYRPLAVPPAVRDSVLEAGRSRLRTAPSRMASSVLPHIRVPEYQPTVTRSIEAEDDTYWIEREEYPAAARQVLVLNGSLDAVATVEIPSRARRVAGPVTAQHIWFLELDDLDVPCLVRYRIVR
jgi:hypothetical protein